MVEVTPNPDGLAVARRLAAWGRTDPDAIVRAYLNPEVVTAELDAEAYDAGFMTGLAQREPPHA